MRYLCLAGEAARAALANEITQHRMEARQLAGQRGQCGRLRFDSYREQETVFLQK